MEGLQIVYLSPDELTPYEGNTRKHAPDDIDQIKESILQDGFNDPIGIWGSNNLIVEGHGRQIAAKELGLEKVPCIRLDHLTDTQRRDYAIRHNRTAELSGWDFGKLEEEVARLEIEGVDLSGLKFDFDGLTGGGDNNIDIVEDEVPEVPEEPKSKRGDIYQLGRHRLMCGDSTEEDDVKKLLNGASVELVFTDPPYQLKTQGGGILKTANSMKQIKQNGVDNFNPSVLKLYGRTNVFCHNKPLIKDYIELAENNKMPYDLAFYKKKNSVPNYKGHLMTDVEYIAIIGNQDPNKGLDKETYSKCFIGQKDSDNELSYSKPVALCAKYVLLYSNKSVLDLFGGSGSTLIACEQLGRYCCMMELDPKYVDVIIQRWENLTGEKAVKLN